MIRTQARSRYQKPLLWGAFVAAMSIPVIAAAFSPQLAWRQPIYIIAGFAGILAMALLLAQALLAGSKLPGIAPRKARRLHRWGGAVLVVLIIAHVGGLWVTSPPDVVDALLFQSPTQFSVWGVLAMWAAFLSAGLALSRGRIPPPVWRLCHAGLVSILVVGTVLHALLIDGTMEKLTKVALCAIIVVATVNVLRAMRRRWLMRA